MTETHALGLRARNRQAITALILDSARAHLAAGGATDLSLRAIAREVGMSSSAIYRYFPSRDELLTALIIDAYNSLADHVEAGEARVRRSDHAGRFRAIGRGIRSWAFTNEHEYALIFGTPIPGYAAPQDTVGPASRLPGVLTAILVDAAASGIELSDRPVPPRVQRAIAPVVEYFMMPDGEVLPDDVVVRGLMAWTYIFGAVTFDLFGHRHNVIVDERAIRNPFFEAELDRLIELMGLA